MGSVRKTSSGKWEVRYSDGKRANGSYRQKSVSVVAANKTEAKKEMRRILDEVESGARKSDSEAAVLSVEDYLRHWLEAYAKPELAHHTSERYEAIIEKHLIPAFGHFALHKLRRMDIREQYARWRESGRLDGSKGGLSAATIIQHHNVFHKALDMAVEDKLVLRNEAHRLRPRRGSRKERRWLDEAQCAKLLTTARSSTLYVPILLMLNCGLRRGEILALRWKDVDLEARSIVVRLSLEQTKAHGIQFKAPKNGKVRTLPIGPDLVDALKSHKAEQNAIRLQLGPSYKDQDIVFANHDGSPRDPGGVTSSFRKLAKAAGFGDMGPHVLRHTAATLMLSQGVHPKVASERLGHSSIALTMDMYSHVSPTMQEEAAEKIEAALRSARSAKILG